MRVIVASRIRDGAVLVQNAAEVIETLRPLALAAAVAEPGARYDQLPDEIGDGDRNAVRDLLSHSPVAVDELVRLSGMPMPHVQTLLLELELAGRLARHAGGRVSLAG